MTKGLFVFLQIISFKFMLFSFNTVTNLIKQRLKYLASKEFDQKLEEELVRRLAKVTGASLEDFAKSLLAKEKELDSRADDLNKREKELYCREWTSV